MTVLVGLLIGTETWNLHERSINSIRSLHPDLSVVTYYSVGSDEARVVQTLKELNVDAINIGKPGLLPNLSTTDYTTYNTQEFNIKTSFE